MKSTAVNTDVYISKYRSNVVLDMYIEPGAKL